MLIDPSRLSDHCERMKCRQKFGSHASLPRRLPGGRERTDCALEARYMAGHRSKAWIFGVAVALAVGGVLFGGAKGLPAKAGPSCIGFSHGQYVSNVGFAGQVHVFEYNSCDSALEHDWFSGSWHSEILDGSGATPYSGNQTTNSVGKWNRSIVCGGQLHNFYYDDVAGSLRHAWWNGSTWNFEYLDGNSSSYTGHSVDFQVGYSEDTTSHSVFTFGSQLQLFYPDTCNSCFGGGSHEKL